MKKTKKGKDRNFMTRGTNAEEKSKMTAVPGEPPVWVRAVRQSKDPQENKKYAYHTGFCKKLYL